MSRVDRRIGQRVEILWGKHRGRYGTIVEIEPGPGAENMVVVEYKAKVALPLVGIEVGDPVRVFLHWRQTEPTDLPRRR